MQGLLVAQDERSSVGLVRPRLSDIVEMASPEDIVRLTRSNFGAFKKQAEAFLCDEEAKFVIWHPGARTNWYGSLVELDGGRICVGAWEYLMNPAPRFAFLEGKKCDGGLYLEFTRNSTEMKFIRNRGNQHIRYSTWRDVSCRVQDKFTILRNPRYQ